MPYRTGYPSAFHDGNAIADLHRLIEILADEYDRFLQALLQAEKLILQAGADQRIERRKWFIHEQDRRASCEGAGESDALLHAAGKFADLALGPVLQIDQFQLLLHCLGAFLLWNARELKAETDILFHGAPRQQTELLKTIDTRCLRRSRSVVLSAFPTSIDRPLLGTMMSRAISD